MTNPFTNAQIDLLLHLVDAGIEAEVQRVCNAPTEPLDFESLVNNANDKAFAASMAIGLTA